MTTEKYVASCRDCGYLIGGAWSTVSRSAYAHEQRDPEQHRMQLWPKATHIAPLPRDMWAKP